MEQQQQQQQQQQHHFGIAVVLKFHKGEPLQHNQPFITQNLFQSQGLTLKRPPTMGMSHLNQQSAHSDRALIHAKCYTFTLREQQQLLTSRFFQSGETRHSAPLW
jgi:hypothetical protein